MAAAVTHSVRSKTGSPTPLLKCAAVLCWGRVGRVSHPIAPHHPLHGKLVVQVISYRRQVPPQHLEIMADDTQPVLVVHLRGRPAVARFISGIQMGDVR